MFIFSYMFILLYIYIQLYIYVCVCVYVYIHICSLMGCKPPGSSVHQISQARILRVGCHFLL